MYYVRIYSTCSCSTCSRVSRALCPTWFRTSCPLCLRASRTSFPPCSRAPRTSCSPCPFASRIPCLPRPLASRASSALVPYLPFVPSTLCAFCANLNFVFLCSHASFISHSWAFLWNLLQLKQETIRGPTSTMKLLAFVKSTLT